MTKNAWVPLSRELVGHYYQSGWGPNWTSDENNTSLE